MYLFVEFVSVLYFVTVYHIKPIGRTLYWLLHCLSVKQCVNYKMASLMFKVLSSLTPAYLSDLIQGAVSVWHLWSSDALLLSVRQTQTELSQLVFSVMALDT